MTNEKNESLYDQPWQRPIPGLVDALAAGGVTVDVVAAFVNKGGINPLVGRVVSIENDLPVPVIRIILTQDFGSAPAGTMMNIVARQIAAFGRVINDPGGWKRN